MVCNSSSCASNYDLTLAIKNLQNGPIVLNISESITISTIDSDGNIIDSNYLASEKVSPTTPAAIAAVSIIRDTAIVDSEVHLDVELTNSNIWPQNAEIILTLYKSEVVLNSSLSSTISCYLY